MQKIYPIKQLIPLIQQAKKLNKTIGLSTGSYDILHLGIIKFFQECKKECDILIIGVESDKNCTTLHGKQHPLNTLQNRIEFLEEINSVNFIFELPGLLTNNNKKDRITYTKRLIQINPTFLMIPKWDIYFEEKAEQALQAKVKVKIINLEYQEGYW